MASPWLLRQAQQRSLTPQCALQSLVGQLPKEKRRRLSAQPAVQTDPGADGIAIGLDGHVYSDTAITDAVAQVGQLGPLNPKVAVCHFPPQDRSQWQASPPYNIQACSLEEVQRGTVYASPSRAISLWGHACFWPEERYTATLVHSGWLLTRHSTSCGRLNDWLRAAATPTTPSWANLTLLSLRTLKVQESDASHTGQTEAPRSRTVLSLGSGGAGEVP